LRSCGIAQFERSEEMAKNWISKLQKDLDIVNDFFDNSMAVPILPIKVADSLDRIRKEFPEILNNVAISNAIATTK
jgi:hypothetical protein